MMMMMMMMMLMVVLSLEVAVCKRWVVIMHVYSYDEIWGVSPFGDEIIGDGDEGDITSSCTCLDHHSHDGCAFELNMLDWCVGMSHDGQRSRSVFFLIGRHR